ncbi:MAG: hypothetical protein ACU0DW_13695 [Shimia sp.]
MTDENRKDPKKSDGRNPDGTFGPGNPGKPKGARRAATKLALTLLDEHAGRLTEQLINAALGGDVIALRICMERVAPARKDAPVTFDLPPMENATDAAQAASAILKAVSEGDLTPAEGASVIGLVDAYRRTLETTEIEERLARLEGSNQ